MKLAWRDDYSTGISEIDDQHKQLLQLLARASKVLGDCDEPALTKLIGDLEAYAAFHFTSEEQLMERVDVDQVHRRKHISEHRNYWLEMSRFWDRVKLGDRTVPHALNIFLEQWWTSHICTIDREMGRLLVQLECVPCRTAG